ncbi:MAG: FHA domain-containing protein [Myxococcales bacterium]
MEPSDKPLVEGDELEAVDRVGPIQGQGSPDPLTRHCPAPAELKVAARVEAPGMASTRIMPLPPGVKASLEIDEPGNPPVPVLKTVTVIGRLPDVADFALPFSEEVSREHAAIVYFAGEFFLEDLGSENGTFVGDEKVVKVKLRDGVRIRIGSQTLVFRFKA